MANLGLCTRHPDQPAAFRCRQCRDSLCRQCRASGERDLCTTCQQYFREQGEVERRGPVDEFAATRKQRRRTAGRYAIAALVAIDLLLGGLWLFVANPFVSLEVKESLDDVAILSRIVEENRDTGGRVAVDIRELAERCPPRIADMIRRGEFVYTPSEDRSGFEVSRFLGPPQA